MVVLLIDRKVVFVVSWGSPPHWSVDRRIKRDPPSFTKGFEIDMREHRLPLRVEPNQHQTHWMTDRFEHGRQQDGHVIAIASSQFQHAPRRVQQFDAMNIACITHVVLYPGKERPDLSQVILRWDTVLKENVDRRLSDTEIFRSLFD